MRVKPGAKQTSVEKQADGSFLIKVKERAVEGRANEAVLEAVADYFDIPKNRAMIIRGRQSRNKVIEL